MYAQELRCHGLFVDGIGYPQPYLLIDVQATYPNCIQNVPSNKMFLKGKYLYFSY